MKRKGFVAFILLIVAALTAAMGTGAIDVFKADRSAAMKVVTDTNGLISLVGDGLYAKEAASGKLTLDFTNTANGGKGFNPQANSEFNEVFTVTNKSEKSVYVWLEADGWSSQHNAGLQYRINNTDGVVTNVDAWYGNTQPSGKNLLDSTGMNFVNGVGKEAYVLLSPGQKFDVNIYVNTVLANGYGSPGSDWSHTVKVKASTTKPTR
ncbi:DUF1102 domain-containing protein [Lederbergia panacisoli]|uniref:DUF1102 domain-containing protein n=1 Tax=Lederbergia panacisoli TaxID=1255251 RepID=UPI00214AE2A2|nr:DUF1102 domain-containing protein [Lederbergia panacisoli]MCR2823281.1 DUF1102 domain-containing protein [Lederbergia panacisoli]